MFIPAEQRTRHAFIERSLEGAYDLLHHEAVGRALGGKVAELEGILHSYVIPNVRDGRVEFGPAHRQTEALPIVAARPQEVLSLPLEAILMTPEQRRTAQRAVEDWECPDYCSKAYIDILDRDLADLYATTERPVSLPARYAARAHSWGYDVPLPSVFASAMPEQTTLTGRPTLLLTYKTGAQAARPATVLHETVHMKQNYQHPLRIAPWNRMNTLSRELEACYVGAAALVASSESGPLHPLAPEDAGQLMLETIRSAHYSGDPEMFRPSEAIITDMQNSGLRMHNLSKGS